MTEYLYPLAIQRPGPDWKRWPEVNTFHGVIEHSMEGYEAGAWAQLDGSVEVSWHFSVMQDGRVFQHYKIDQSPWHAGGKVANLRLIGIEYEGVAGQPLTEAQVRAGVPLTRWVAVQGGWEMQHAPGATQTLFEHREVNHATTCPNGRIPWDRYEEDEMTTHALSQAEMIVAGRAIGAGAGLALSGVGGRSIRAVDDSPPGTRAYVVTVLEEDTKGVNS